MAKREEIRMIFSGGVMCENYHFFTTPRWSEKALFCTIFFSLNIDSDHRSVHLGWLIWVFWECMVKKMINFPAQWHIKEFYNSNFFEFWIFCFKSLLWLFGSVFHGSQASMAKREEIRKIFFWRCHVWKITIFSQPRGGQKRHFFAQFFFSEYRFWSQVGASGVVYLSFLRIYDEKVRNFSAQWHIKVFLEFKLF